MPKMKKALALVLSVCMLLTALPAAAFGENGENSEPATMCSNHLEHTEGEEGCGYVAPAKGEAGAACTHSCELCRPVLDSGIANGLSAEDAALLNTAPEKLSLADQLRRRQLPQVKTATGRSTTPAADFVIASADHLAELARYVNAGDTSYNAASYQVTKNLDLSDYPNWTPIGTIGNPFAGQFDGGGVTITGLTITSVSDDYQGLFGAVNGTSTAQAQVKNIIVKNASILGSGAVGPVVGSYGANTQPLKSCAMVGGSVEGTRNIGGVAGETQGAITGCYATGSVTGAGDNIGGVAGYAADEVTACYATGSVEGAEMVGGVVGSGSATACVALNQAVSSSGGAGGRGGCAHFHGGRSQKACRRCQGRQHLPWQNRCAHRRHRPFGLRQLGAHWYQWFGVLWRPV